MSDSRVQLIILKLSKLIHFFNVQDYPVGVLKLLKNDKYGILVKWQQKALCMFNFSVRKKPNFYFDKITETKWEKRKLLGQNFLEQNGRIYE